MTSTPSRTTTVRGLLAALALALIGTAVLAAPALAAKEVIAYFGTAEENGTGSKGGEFGAVPNGDFGGDVAVNATGVGPANKGEIYVADGHRIQRFAQDDNGTPADPYDDSYPFVSTWGAGVETGGTDFQLCTVAANCRMATPSGGNGTAAGNGALKVPLGGALGVAIDQDTGDLYISDVGNFRVNVYSGDGAFLRSFGQDVVSSGPGDNGSGYEICVAANGDVCKAGTSGAGPGQLAGARSIAVSPPDGNPATGTVFVADETNQRVVTYGLAGTAPSSFGSAANFTLARRVAVDSRGIVYVSDGEQQIDRYDSQNANGGGVGFLASIEAPPLLPNNHNGIVGLQVDPDLDGVGPETDALYALITPSSDGDTVIQQYGPLNPPGLTAAPSAIDAVNGATAQFNIVFGLGLDISSGRLFVSTQYPPGGPFQIGKIKAGVYVLDAAGGPPTASIGSVDAVTSRSATVHATVDPNGPPDVAYRLEYSTDGVSWKRTAETLVGRQETPQAIDAVLDPPGTGLLPGTLYHVRLVATKSFMPPVVTSALTFTTSTSAPQVETVGSPVRTTTTAWLEGRVNPLGVTTTYHFEYGAQGPCDANPCQSTAPVAVGSGTTIRLVSQSIAGIAPGTVYHYRLVADNGNPGSPAAGEDMTVTTRSSAALSHGRFAGPPGSDRAWEQVSLAETSGNPVQGGMAFSDDGGRAVYSLPGGTPITDTGSAFNQYFAERTPSGWQSRKFLAPRSEIAGPNWAPPFVPGDLSTLFTLNNNVTTGAISFWRLVPGGTNQRLLDTNESAYGGFFLASDDGSRDLVVLKGPADPLHPAPAGIPNFYDVTDGSPQLVSLLPGDQIAPCGVTGLPPNWPRRVNRMVSPDGSLLAFSSLQGGCTLSPSLQLYLRDIPAGSTSRVSSPPLSGPTCNAFFSKQTPGAVFFTTASRLVAEDTAPLSSTCTDGNDVYRYEVESEDLECVTCAVPGLAAEVASSAVSEDGSHVYFGSARALTRGAVTPAVYRVDVASEDLAYVAPASSAGAVNDNPEFGNALNPDGDVFMFRSDASALNPVNGPQNGGTFQFYRYDDRDRSLTCVSCPQNGSTPDEEAVNRLQTPGSSQTGTNVGPLAADGETLIFLTPNSLLSADQNTAIGGQGPEIGNDLYEWRDGRQLLVSDGLTSWPDVSVGPTPNGISPSGRDVYFTVSAQYTPDALDSYNRLYDARIGGGIEFPQAPKPCPLEVCQGTPKGAPAAPPLGSKSFTGAGNVKSKPKKKKKKKHHRSKHGQKHRAAGNDRRVSR